MKTFICSLFFCCFVVLPGFGQEHFYVPDILYVKMKDDAGYAVKGRQLVNTNTEQAAVLGRCSRWATGSGYMKRKMRSWSNGAGMLQKI